MYHIGDVVIYGTDGICEIREITDVRFGHETNEYYILSPVNRETDTFYVPTTESQVLKKMRPVLSKKEAEDIIAFKTNVEIPWINEDRKRTETYKNYLMYGSCEEILGVLRTLHNKRAELEKIGKNLHSIDERCLRDAQKLLVNELVFVLNLNQDEVLDLIEKLKR